MMWFVLALLRRICVVTRVQIQIYPQLDPNQGVASYGPSMTALHFYIQVTSPHPQL